MRLLSFWQPWEGQIQVPKCYLSASSWVILAAPALASSLYTVQQCLSMGADTCCMSGNRATRGCCLLMAESDKCNSVLPPGGTGSRKTSTSPSLPNPDLLPWALRTLLSQHGLWSPRAAGSSAEVRLDLHSSCWGFVSSGLLSHQGITLGNCGKEHLNPLLVCGVMWATRSLWEETEAVTVVLIRFLPGKNSKWAILVIQDSSAVALWHVPNIDYTHSPGLLACLNRVFCRCWCNFPSWDLFSFTWSYKGP